MHIYAEVAELADAVDSKSTGARLCAGSSPALGTRVPNIIKREQKSGGVIHRFYLFLTNKLLNRDFSQVILTHSYYWC